VRRLEGCNASYFNAIALPTFEGEQVSAYSLMLDPEQAHFDLAVRTKNERFCFRL
jgi:hypothetical protein